MYLYNQDTFKTLLQSNTYKKVERDVETFVKKSLKNYSGSNVKGSKVIHDPI